MVPSFSPRVPNSGFIMALVLSGLCLILAGWYMINFEYATSAAIDKMVSNGDNCPQDTLQLAFAVQMYTSRILLLSCGILVGLAFGFLGFSLFLVGVKGDVDADLDAGERFKLKLARLSPGLFVILCSAILIGYCATQRMPVNLSLPK